jgi:hypothetical protein
MYQVFKIEHRNSTMNQSNTKSSNHPCQSKIINQEKLTPPIIKKLINQKINQLKIINQIQTLHHKGGLTMS